MRKASAQEDCVKQINCLTADLLGLRTRMDTGLILPHQINDLKLKENEKLALENKLKNLKAAQKRSLEFRKNQKRKLQQIIDDNPEAASVLHARELPGRPRLEDDQPELLKAIVEIAIHGSAAHERRNSETLK